MFINMIKLYDRSGTAVGIIPSFFDLHITEQINSPDSIEFSVPLDEEMVPLIMVEGYVAINDTASNEDWYQLFTIKSISADIESAEMKVYGIARIDELLSTLRDKTLIKNKTAVQALTTALSGTGWTLTTVGTAPSQKASLEIEHHTVYEVISDIVEKWGVEVSFDGVNKTLKLYASLGDNSGNCILWEQLNAIGISVEEDSSNVSNHLTVIGKEVDGTRVTASAVDELTDLGRTAYTVGKRINGYYIDNDEENSADLRAGALRSLEGSSVPKYSFGLTIADLAMVDDSWSHFDFGLGDVVKLMSPTLSDRVNGMPDVIHLRIVKIDRYPNNPEQTKIDIANTASTLDNIVAKTIKNANASADSFGYLMKVPAHTHQRTVDDNYSSQITLDSGFTSLLADANGICRRNPAVNLYELRMNVQYVPPDAKSAGTRIKVGTIPADAAPSSVTALAMVSGATSAVTRTWSAWVTYDGNVYMRSSDALTAGSTYGSLAIAGFWFK